MLGNVNAANAQSHPNLRMTEEERESLRRREIAADTQRVLDSLESNRVSDQQKQKEADVSVTLAELDRLSAKMADDDAELERLFAEEL